MELTYYTSGGGSGTDGGDQYTGLDRFGRVIDQRWDRSGTDLERLKYGYDQVGNRVWRQNTVAEAASANQDEYYTEDGLYQIKTLKRGTLTGTPPTGISGTPTWEEDWNFDPLGNWRGSSSAYKTLVSGTTTLDQNRSHSTVNAISGITTTTGTSWTSPVHDAAGNMTTAPKPLPLGLGSAYTLKYDAWNRLVEVKSGSTVVATYAYDGVNRRVTKTTSVTRHYYYDDRWRVVEERVDAATTADLRFVWGTRRWDDLILRDRIYSSTGGSSSSSSAGPTTERLYVMDDLANVTAVVDTTGTVQERYGYNGFGGVRYMTPSFVTRSASIYYWETLFGSYRYDTETGLYQVRHRYFHPLLGRWINRDPIGERGGINLYAYVENQPIRSSDSSGLGLAEVVPEEPGWTPVVVEGGAEATAEAAAIGLADVVPPLLIATGIGALLAKLIDIGSDLLYPDHSAPLPLPPNSQHKPKPRPTPSDEPFCEPAPGKPKGTNSDCDNAVVRCVANPWQPEWNIPNYGRRKDCQACYQECNNDGHWPSYKCPE